MGINGERITTFFNGLNKDTMGTVLEFYSPQACFFDPLVALEGSQNIQNYYTGLYKNVSDIKFEFSQITESGNWVAAAWDMRLKAANLKAGEEVVVPGISHIQFDQISAQVIYHRDYFDLGAFIYEHIPVLGTVIRFVKKKMH